MYGPEGARRIRAVAFDLDGTLLDWRDFPQLEELAEESDLPIDVDALAHSYQTVSEENDREGERMVPEQFWRRVVEGSLGRPADETKWNEFYGRWQARTFAAQLYSDVRLCLASLHEGGQHLAVVSDRLSEAAAREILQREGVARFFDAVIGTDSEKIGKPDPDFFRAVTVRLGTAPEETLFVGDQPNSDARAAERAGLHGLWLHRDGTGFGEDPPEVTTLAEVSVWIAQFELQERVRAATSGRRADRPRSLRQVGAARGASPRSDAPVK